MAKKKTTPKKHRFKHVESSSARDQPMASTTVSEGVVTKAARPVMASDQAHTYVMPDLRRTAMLSGVLIALELVFYYVMVYTAVGEAIYKMVKV